jgi:hypothetical protein
MRRDSRGIGGGIVREEKQEKRGERFRETTRGDFIRSDTPLLEREGAGGGGGGDRRRGGRERDY